MDLATHRFRSDRQNFMELASIQSATIGLAITGQQLTQQYETKTVICSILFGNLIIWLVAIAITSMVYKKHANAIENIKGYIGKYGALLSILILICAFMNWYAFQINLSTTTFANLLQLSTEQEKTLIIRFGAVIGLFTALLAIGGIRMVRTLCVLFLPIFIGYVIYSLLTSKQAITLRGDFQPALPIVSMTIFSMFTGIINLPTFFRHSLSKAHSFLGITLFTILFSFFQIASIWMDFSPFTGPDATMRTALLIGFLIVLAILSNLSNIYLASACWEALVPRYLGGGKEYAIIGLLGTLVYTFVQISTPVQFLQDLTNAYIAILGIVLLLAYLTRIVARHRPRPHEKRLSLGTWLVGCVVTTIYEAQHVLQGTDALLAGINASILLFITILFIEETVWAVRSKVRTS